MHWWQYVPGAYSADGALTIVAGILGAVLIGLCLAELLKE